jgi:type I restriction enzyme, S subunit
MVKKVKLSSICEILDNKRIPLSDNERQIRIKNKKIDVLYPYYGATKQVGYIDDYIFDDELILLGEDGVMFYDISKPKAYLIKGKSWVNNHAHVLKINNTKANTNYVLYYLNIFNYQGYVSGSTRLKLNKSKMSEIPVPLPTLEKQNQIAKTLDKANELVELRKESITKLDALAKSIFIDMFGDPVSNPKKWEEVKLGTLMKIRRGASPRPIANFIGDDIPWIKIGDGTKGSTLYIENTKVKIISEGKNKSVYLKKGSLIFANCGVSLGFCRILKIDGCIHDGWLSFEDIDSKLNDIFVLKLINNSTKRLQDSASGGTQPNLNIDIMKNFIIYLPPINLQNKFAKIIEKIEEQKKLYTQELEKLQENFDALLQKSFQ